jgi:hypothetical protein
MKQVWLARDRRLGGRLCALAEMIDSFAAPTARAAAEAAFRREAELLGSLSDEHLPQIYDSFSERMPTTSSWSTFLARLLDT